MFVLQVARVARVLGVPGGHALLVGVGGSGKQSLARLAAHVAGCEAVQLTVSAGYGIPEFRAVSGFGGQLFCIVLQITIAYFPHASVRHRHSCLLCFHSNY